MYPIHPKISSYMNNNFTWSHPYTPTAEYQTRVAYFSMEFGIDAALKIYSGGLGYLAGSHMRAAYALKQNMIGIGMLWKYGYYDQMRDSDSKMKVLYRERIYSFLQPTDLIFPVMVNNHEVKVQAFYLAPEVFGTVPMYLLTTDGNMNDYLSATISHHLYDPNTAARIAQNIVLGIGGLKVVQALGGTDRYHMNEAHALPLAFELYKQLQSVDKVKEKVVFTTHTPVKAGNEERDIHLLNKMGFFAGVPLDTVRDITDCRDSNFGYTPAALKLAGNSNGVSQLHAEVSNEMWKHIPDKPNIIGITNSQNKEFWTDKPLQKALDTQQDEAFKARKRELKASLFELVADQTGKLFDPDVLTIVWARRFAGYKRADLIMRNAKAFYDLLDQPEYPIQIIWAGKPYPQDESAVDLFNSLIQRTRYCKNAVVMTGYEMNLSAALKKGSDVWLNTPRRPKEASGTSGMTAAMNGSVNFSVDDGWVPEFGKHGHNSFVLPHADIHTSEHAQDEHDYDHLWRILTTEIMPCYYETPEKWLAISQNSMKEVTPYFDANRMADEYYKRLFDAKG